MKTTLTATSLTLTLLLTVNAQAASTQPSTYKTEENIGFGSGFVMGALMGGPIGAIVGGVTGVALGHAYGVNAEVDELRTDLAKNEMNVAMLTKHNQALLEQVALAAENEVKLKRVSFQTENDDQLEHGLSMVFQYRTGSAEVESLYQTQLVKLANALTNLPDMQIEIVGYADNRGDEHYNHQLSAQRAESLKVKLVALGVASERIITRAHGEITSDADRGQPHDKEGLFFHRRAMVNLVPINTQTAAIH